jgi:acid phosphatase family membrane protein YuiD
MPLPYILVPLLSWVLSQVIKVIISIIKGEDNIKLLFSSGSMPSAHSAAVSSLVSLILIDKGYHDPLFGIVLLFAAIVMYDSFGVRRVAGELSIKYNDLLDRLEAYDPRQFLSLPRQEVVKGHTFREVLVGSILGIVLGASAQYTKLSSAFSSLGTIPSLDLIKLYATISIILLAIGLSISYLIRIKRAANYMRIFSVPLWGSSVLSLVILFSQYQKTGRFNGHLFNILPLVLLIIWVVLNLKYSKYSQEYKNRNNSTDSKENQRREKWLAKEKAKRA